MPKVLRKLRIEDVSSVDVGAGRGVKVVLAKRGEGDMARMRKCPHCQGTGLTDKADNYEKRGGEVTVAKIHEAAAMSFDSLLEHVMDTEKMSKRDATKALANGTASRDVLAQLSENHRQEMAMRFGRMGLT
jgi:hypothetical protein